MDWDRFGSAFETSGQILASTGRRTLHYQMRRERRRRNRILAEAIWSFGQMTPDTIYIHPSIYSDIPDQIDPGEEKKS